MIDSNQKYYFIGIGGIGMSGLAGYLKQRGCPVAGYDLTPSSITEKLAQSGIPITYSSDVSDIPSGFIGPDVTVVYTPAVPKQHQQLNYFIQVGNNIIKRAALLGKLSQKMPMIAVAGTHGKTSTSSLITHLLLEAKIPLSAFVGGIISQYKTNFIDRGDDVVVVEADEFDRSFLHLFPTIGCITSMDADHLDIYKTHQELKNSFVQFSSQIKQQCIVNYGLEIQGTTYGFNQQADYYPMDIEQTPTGYKLNIHTPSKDYYGIEFHQIGKHNLSNLMCAIAAIDQLTCPMDKVMQSIKNFKGIERRMHVEMIDSVVFIDDYAHHPSELNAVYQSINHFYNSKKSCVIFQPHLYTRTRDFMDDFAKVLSKFDQVILLDIYPAREQAIKGIHSHALLDKIENAQKSLIAKKDIEQWIQSTDAEVILFLGAGDIGLEYQKVIKRLKHSI
ncbi:MAG: UDP-N-acetylmuramate--L-alanine ligase [Flavobacteriaceae bacterium]|nr:UDP-N-acetylmuramate--L-alanine ligase [Flavobacteriaceae bacterium]MCY4268199.1 UDP-N-acetylmuramate--L-alanine ligase [Flavobacteriaceae bacterium]